LRCLSCSNIVRTLRAFAQELKQKSARPHEHYSTESARNLSLTA
jgi:hypothetical protein